MAAQDCTVVRRRGRGVLDLKGQRFGHWTVLGFAGLDGSPSKNAKWHCRCDCGTERAVFACNLKKRPDGSCGCKSPPSPLLIHGMSETREHAIYCSAMRRCRAPTHREWRHYGGRGIEFRYTSFMDFMNDLGPRPSSKHSVDRINNDGHYEPGNCRWATKVEQMQNMRTNKRIETPWGSLVVAEAARRANLAVMVLHNRIRNFGWCTPCALTIRPRHGSCQHKVKRSSADLTLSLESHG